MKKVGIIFPLISYLFILQDFDLDETPKSGRRKSAAGKGRAKVKKKLESEEEEEAEEKPKSARKPAAKPRKQSAGSAKKGIL